MTGALSLSGGNACFCLASAIHARSKGVLSLLGSSSGLGKSGFGQLRTSGFFIGFGSFIQHLFLGVRGRVIATHRMHQMFASRLPGGNKEPEKHRHHRLANAPEGLTRSSRDDPGFLAVVPLAGFQWPLRSQP
jgi:hypothetical protein